MRFVLCFTVAFLSLVAQGILHHIGLSEWLIPQGVLICVVFLAFYECSVAGALAAFVLGLLLDSSSGVLLGPWAGAYIVVYAVFSFVSQRLFVESLGVAMVVVASAAVLSGVIFLLLAFEYQAVTREDFGMLLGQALSSALIAPVLFKALKLAWRRSGVMPFKGRNRVVSAV